MAGTRMLTEAVVHVEPTAALTRTLQLMVSLPEIFKLSATQLSRCVTNLRTALAVHVL